MVKRHRDPTISAHCRAQHGMPHRPEDAHCWGCTCGCHAVKPPANFRQIVARWRARAAEARQDAEPTDGQETT